MPGFDGTGPRGMGPMTGRGEGYCAFTIPAPGTGESAYGYAGLLGPPGEMVSPYSVSPAYGSAPYISPVSLIGRTRPWLGRYLGYGWGRGRGRGRGRWF